jgi:hypothetical protein
MRRCSDCKHTKPLGEFRKRSAPRRGYLSPCIPCLRLRWRRWAYGVAA